MGRFVLVLAALLSLSCSKSKSFMEAASEAGPIVGKWGGRWCLGEMEFKSGGKVHLTIMQRNLAEKVLSTSELDTTYTTEDRGKNPGYDVIVDIPPNSEGIKNDQIVKFPDGRIGFLFVLEEKVMVDRKGNESKVWHLRNDTTMLSMGSGCDKL